jgi:hypothetical protein
MMNLKHLWHQAADKERWNARRTAFVAKLGATKAVWFPPEPTGKQAASKGRNTTKRAAKKTTRSASKAKRPTKQAARGSSR